MSTSEPATEAVLHRYDANFADTVERHWQDEWERHQTFRTPNPGDTNFDGSRPKYYCLDMFPYPSGAGLHVGHPEGYTATDIICRYKRMKGFNVLHPMGWDAFGLPAEQYAIQTGVHPAVTTRKAIDNFRRQLKRFGFSYDWSREFATIDPEYYRWTQWIWLKAYDAWYNVAEDRAQPISELIELLSAGELVIDAHDELRAPDTPGTVTWAELDETGRRRVIDNQRLAYIGEQTVNWCPKLGTALANEEVIDGKSERGQYPVLRKPLRQWMFRITSFADRLERDLDLLDWPESTRTMQREWIGRSEGAEVDFPLADSPNDDTSLRVYTTRPDTIFGATYMVVAPEHPIVAAMLAKPNDGTNVDALRDYVDAARNRADVDRMSDTREKTGVDTGFHCVNPATGSLIPIWVADYVLMGYGHGAIMAVPAHDDRDFEFARVFDLPIVDVVHTLVHRSISAFCDRIDRVDPDTQHDDLLRLAADFVGYVVNADDQSGFSAPDAPAWDKAWQTAYDRRHSPFDHPNDSRGRIVHVWMDSLEAYFRGDPGQLVETVNAGGLARHAGGAITESGRAVNSANDEVSLNGLTTDEAKDRIIAWFESGGIGRRTVNYRLRDWLFSRQRYWGEPFPIVFDEAGNHYPVTQSHLPVTLPELADYEPVESDDPVPLLAKATDWLNTTAGEAGVDPALLPPETPVRREANTMPGWAGSCWYYLRYCDPQNDERFAAREAERYWMLSSRVEGESADDYGTFMPDIHHLGGVDLYVGGAEHAVLHLLYARFWHKILFDLGEAQTPEPFGRLFHQGMITSFAYQRADKTLVPIDEVEETSEGNFIERATGEAVHRTTAKMSKSLRNVINPDDIIKDYGADTFRLYEMYMGPLEASKPWNTQDITGPHRFLQRAWRTVIDEDTGKPDLAESADADVEKALHAAIAKTGEDIERFAFNTAIASQMEFVNVATKRGRLTRDQAERFARILGPFAPHLAEEIWHRLGNETLIADEPWPTFNEDLLKADLVELPVQVMGKVRGRLEVAAEATPAAVEELALESPRIQEAIGGKTVRKVIVVPGKIVNIIVG